MSQEWRRTHRVKDIKILGKTKSVSIIGWIDSIGIQKEKILLTLRDGTGKETFAIYSNNKIINKISRIPVNSVIGLKGEFQRYKKEKILILRQFKVFSRASKDFPIKDFNKINDITLLPKRALLLRSPRLEAILKVRNEIYKAIRSFFDANEFIEITPSVLSLSTDPAYDIATLTPSTPTLANYVLSSSAQFYKQASLSIFDRVYTLFPSIRGEASLSSRHLLEFIQLDVEMAFSTSEDMMSIIEDMISYIWEYTVERCKTEFSMLGINILKFKTPFIRMTFQEIKKDLYRGDFKENGDISQEAEVTISKKIGGPFWIIDYPAQLRCWYYKRSNRSLTKSFDLIWPEYGEIITGGERENNYRVLIKRIKEMQDDPKRYEWYLEMFKYGMPPSVGFGCGIERLIQCICRLKNIWEATLFPKVPGIICP